MKYYKGAAWYQKVIEVPENWTAQSQELFLERCHISTRLWINEKEIGMRNSLSNAHIYENQYDAVKELLKRKNNHKKIVLTLPPKSFERAEKKDPKLLKAIVDNISSQYKPLEAITGVKIVTWNEYRAKKKIKN